MATSTGKTLGLICIICLVMALVFLRGPGLFGVLGPFGMLFGLRHSIPGIGVWGLGTIPDPAGIFHFVSRSFVPMMLFILWIVAIFWVYKDAERRGMNGLLWALLVFIGNILGFLIYLIVRSDKLSASASMTHEITCPGCAKILEEDFAFCPHCGAKLHSTCPACDKPVESDWQVCPHCGKKLNTGK